MTKHKTIYSCNNCSAQFPKWSGRCTECGQWGTVQEEEAKITKPTKIKADIKPADLVDFQKVTGQDVKRQKTKLEEFDRVLGGGIVPGSLVLIGGEPGIGKSTLILQVAATLSPNKVIYASGEESAEQIKLRFDRLSVKTNNISYLGETNVETICATLNKHKPDLAIIDSIQTMFSAEAPSEAGSINQVRICTVKLLEIAKKRNISIFIVGHVTKEGSVAGPKTLEHLVDTVLYLEGDQQHAYRLLRTQKNRFGSTNEVGVFDMQDKGLIEVKNPSAAFISQRQKAPGAVITCIIEGTRPFLVEIQALVSKTIYGYPQRRSVGFDYNKLQLLATVIAKKTSAKLYDQDIHLNVVGGIKVNEPAADLAVCLAIASALKNKNIDHQTIAFGEVGLTGEIRSVNFMEKRISEAARLGFKNVIIPNFEIKKIPAGIKLHKIDHLDRAIELF